MRERFGDFVLDPGTRQLRRGEEERHLGPEAFELLELLLRHRPNVVAKATIHDCLWPGTFVSESTLATVVGEVRAALSDDAKSPRFLRTAHGVGLNATWSPSGEKVGNASVPGEAVNGTRTGAGRSGSATGERQMSGAPIAPASPAASQRPGFRRTGRPGAFGPESDFCLTSSCCEGGL
jgi:DNA-binding winged helix-turn-helix (wHTH) protein